MSHDAEVSIIRATLNDLIDYAASGQWALADSARRTLDYIAIEYRDGGLRYPVWVEIELRRAGLRDTP